MRLKEYLRTNNYKVIKVRLKVEWVKRWDFIESKKTDNDKVIIFRTIIH